MTAKITEQDNQVVVILEGNFDTASSEKMQLALAPLFDYKNCDIRIDCTGLNYISSYGLRTLLSIFKHTNRTGNKTILIRPKESILDVFRVSGFDKLFVIEK